MKVIIEHIYTHEQLRFSSLKDLNEWILNKKVFWNAQSLRIWSICGNDAGKKIPFRRCIRNLLQYVKHYNLLNYDKKEEFHRFCNPCGFPISKL